MRYIYYTDEKDRIVSKKDQTHSTCFVSQILGCIMHLVIGKLRVMWLLFFAKLKPL